MIFALAQPGNGQLYWLNGYRWSAQASTSLHSSSGCLDSHDFMVESLRGEKNHACIFLYRNVIHRDVSFSLSLSCSLFWSRQQMLIETNFIFHLFMFNHASSFFSLGFPHFTPHDRDHPHCCLRLRLNLYGSLMFEWDKMLS